MVKTFTCLAILYYYEQNDVAFVACGTDVRLKQQWDAARSIEQNRKLGISAHVLLCLLRHRPQVSLLCRVFVSSVMEGGLSTFLR